VRVTEIGELVVFLKTTFAELLYGITQRDDKLPSEPTDCIHVVPAFANVPAFKDVPAPKNPPTFALTYGVDALSKVIWIVRPDVLAIPLPALSDSVSIAPDP
jgi:hypothetical protein